MASPLDDKKLPEEASRNTSEDLGEKNGGHVSDVVESSDAKDEAATAADEYPHGTQLIFIVTALLLNVFLVALDMVGDTSHVTSVHMANY